MLLVISFLVTVVVLSFLGVVTPFSNLVDCIVVLVSMFFIVLVRGPGLIFSSKVFVENLFENRVVVFVAVVMISICVVSATGQHLSSPTYDLHRLYPGNKNEEKIGNLCFNVERTR